MFKFLILIDHGRCEERDPHLDYAATRKDALNCVEFWGSIYGRDNVYIYTKQED